MVDKNTHLLVAILIIRRSVYTTNQIIELTNISYDCVYTSRVANKTRRFRFRRTDDTKTRNRTQVICKCTYIIASFDKQSIIIFKFAYLPERRTEGRRQRTSNLFCLCWLFVYDDYKSWKVVRYVFHKVSANFAIAFEVVYKLFFYPYTLLHPLPTT